MGINKNIIWFIAIAVMITIGVGWLVWDFILETDHDVVLAVTFAIAAIITFFGFLSMSLKKTEDGWKLSEGGIRTAITVSLVTVYLLLVVFAYALIGPEEIGGLLETMVNSFTTVIGVVIAFYFGASAYIEAKRINDKHKEKK